MAANNGGEMRYEIVIPPTQTCGCVIGVNHRHIKPTINPDALRGLCEEHQHNVVMKYLNALFPEGGMKLEIE